MDSSCLLVRFLPVRLEDVLNDIKSTSQSGNGDNQTFKTASEKVPLKDVVSQDTTSMENRHKLHALHQDME